MEILSRRRGRRRSWGKIRQLPSKRYRADYCGPDNARHSAPHTFSLRTDAEGWLCAERRLIERDEWTPPRLRAAERHARSRTFGSYADDWLSTRQLKPRTKALYRSLLDGPLAKLSGVPLNCLTAATVRAWHAGLGDKTPTRKAHAYSLLRTICNTAVGEDLMDSNPAKIPGAGAAKTKRQPVVLTPDDIAKLAVTIRPTQLRAFVLIASWCGLRFGECAELRRKDINDDGDVISISVRRGCTHTNSGAGTVDCHISTTKNSDARKVPVAPHIRDDIRDHLAAMTDTNPEALVFAPIDDRCHIDEKYVRKQFHQALKDIGYQGDRVNVHDLRHFNGSEVAKHANLAETMAWLGHRTVDASMRYQHMVNGRDAAIAEALSMMARQTPGEADATA